MNAAIQLHAIDTETLERCQMEEVTLRVEVDPHQLAGLDLPTGVDVITTDGDTFAATLVELTITMMGRVTARIEVS